MRKVISFMHLSLDGFTTGPNGELEWAIVDEELNPYVDALFRIRGHGSLWTCHLSGNAEVLANRAHGPTDLATRPRTRSLG